MWGVGEVETSTVSPLTSVLRRARRLSRAEERSLIPRAQQGDTEARQRVIEGNLRLVLYVARRYQSGTLTLDDLLQDGVVGLVDALERYDPAEGHSFSSYAVPWIRLRIGRAVYRMGRIIRLPERNERMLARWHQLCEQAQDQQQAPPTVEHGAQLLGVTADTLRAIVDASHPVSSLSPRDGEGDLQFADDYLISDSAADPLDELMRAEAWSDLYRALTELRPNYRQVLVESYGLCGREPRTLNDIAAQWGVTKQAVSGLRKRALDSLRERVLSAHA